jgi:hypothetical protein
MLFVCSQVCDSCNGLYKILSFAQSFDQFFVYSMVSVTYSILLLNAMHRIIHLTSALQKLYQSPYANMLECCVLTIIQERDKISMEAAIW